MLTSARAAAAYILISYVFGESSLLNLKDWVSPIVAHNGDQVEVQLEDGQWRQVRLQGLPAEILGYGLLPALAGGYELVAKVPLKALFRWPAAG